MSSHKSPRSVPWSCHAEWLFVYHSLFPQTSEAIGRDDLKEFAQESVETALKMIDAWRQRSGLPKAVDTSHTLITILRNQCLNINTPEQSTPERMLDHENTTRHALNSALIRFVNQMCDSEQKSTHAQPILKLANNLGLSRMLVDMRHEGTHDALPCLSWLILGARVALDWLKKHYWQAQEEWKILLKESFAANMRECANSRDVKDRLMDVDHLIHSSETLKQVIAVIFSPEFIVKTEIVRDVLDCLIDWIEIGKIVAMMHGTIVDTAYERYKQEHIQYARQKGKLNIADESMTGTKRKFWGEHEEGSAIDRTKRLIKQLEEKKRKAESTTQPTIQLSSDNANSNDNDPSWTLTSVWSRCPLGTCATYNPLKGQSFKQLYWFP